MNEFIKAYAKDKGLPEVEVAMFAGALSRDTIIKLDTYKQFILTLNQVAPQLIQLNSILSKTNE